MSIVMSVPTQIEKIVNLSTPLAIFVDDPSLVMIDEDEPHFPICLD